MKKMVKTEYIVYKYSNKTKERIAKFDNSEDANKYSYELAVKLCNAIKNSEWGKWAYSKPYPNEDIYGDYIYWNNNGHIAGTCIEKIKYEQDNNITTEDAEKMLLQGIDPKDIFDHIYPSSSDYKMVKLNKANKINFIHSYDKTLLCPQWFDDSRGFQYDMAQVKYDGKWNLIDTNGKILLKQWFDEFMLPSKYEEIGRFNDKWYRISRCCGVINSIHPINNIRESYLSNNKKIILNENDLRHLISQIVKKSLIELNCKQII